MRIKILQFSVVEKYVHRPSAFDFWQRLFGKELDQYHFDTIIKVDPEYVKTGRQLQVNDFLQLPNGVKLLVWSIDRFDIVRAKTYKMTVDDLRGYHPMEMYLVYPHQHGHMQDRAI